MSILARALSPGFDVWSGLSIEAKRALFVFTLGIAFLATHLPFIAPGPGSVDAMNFALAVRDFDLSDHQPHPPGYPVFVALGKITKALVSSGPPEADTVRYEAQALAIWSALFGALAVFPLFKMFRSLEQNDRRAAAATALTVTCPLFWFMAIRPMSDIPGLGAALIVQAVVFSAYRLQERGDWRMATRLLIPAALGAGLAVGLRSQTVWLTLPVLTAVVIRQRRSDEGQSIGFLATVTCAFALGVAIWAVPLVVASGGPSSYLTTLGLQADDDFTGVDMLVTNPSLGRLGEGLVSTFAYPWANKYLAVAILGLAACGAAGMAIRSRRALGWLALAAGPYTLFHLLYQDPTFTRYALPAVPVVAYLAGHGLEVITSRVRWLFAAVLAAAGLAVAASPVLAYATIGAPGYQATLALRRALADEPGPRPVLAIHHEVGRAIRGERLAATQLLFPQRHEWLEVVKYWRAGGSSPVWFLADNSRTDLALIDPASRRLRGTFRLPFDNRFFMSGARPGGVNWYELHDPSWMVGEGWALTPETAGVAWRDARGPSERPIIAWVRRRPEAAVMLIGGRNLGQCGEPDVRFEATIDDRPLASWVVGAEPGFFLQAIDLPPGSLEGDGRYAEVNVSARSADGVIRRINAALEQFEVQSTSRPVFGFDTGWYQLEYDSEARRLWRWMGPWAALRVNNAGRDLTLRIVGDSPLTYLDRIPTVTVHVNGRALGQLEPAADFVWEVKVPADALGQAGGSIIVETDVTFVPDDRLHNGDRRPLGLRIFDVSLQ